MTIDRLNYRLSLKAFSPGVFGNELVRSGNKSLVRTPVKSEKLRRAKVVKIRLTKLLRTDSLPLDGKCIITGKGLSLMWGQLRMYLSSAIIINYQSNKELNPQRSKAIHIGEKGTMGNPKERKFHGFGGSVVDASQREPGIRFYSSSNVIKPSGSDILKELREINSKFTVNTKTIHVISDINILTLAYETIKSSPGNMTPGDDGKTLDGITLALLKKTSSDIKAGKFNFSLARRVYIPKRNKDELRPLGVISPRDKIVQTAMLMVLEAIFEPSFLNTSHGFRPGKSCHTALAQVKNTFSNMCWVVENDISKCYDTINHGLLLDIIKRRIHCEKTLTLIKKLLRNPYKDNGRLVYPKTGTFQGSSLSPLLCNIFLHEFDVYMEDLKRSFNKGNQRRKNPKYRSIQHTLSYNKNLNFLEKRKLSQRLRLLPSKDFGDPNFRRLQYVRYADDFMIGIIGKYTESAAIRQKIKNFLFDTLSLNLNLDKTNITHFNRKSLTFLGTFIKGNQEREKKVHLAQCGKKKRRVRSTSRARLEAPIISIFEKGLENGFFKRTNKGKFAPTFCGRLINLDHADILRFYNQKIRGILNYYSFVDNKKSLGSFVHGLKHSCALTLALKLKLRHRASVFKRFGTKLKCLETGTELYIPKTFSRDQKFNINPEDPKIVMEKRWNNKFTRSNLTKSCLVCGKFPSEMHHLPNIKDLKSKYRLGKQDFWKTQLAAINRKQIPLCKKHHVDLHRDSLTTQEREKLIEAIKDFK
jgi:group II intron reverse transcriptase/maturase